MTHTYPKKRVRHLSMIATGFILTGALFNTVFTGAGVFADELPASPSMLPVSSASSMNSLAGVSSVWDFGPNANPVLQQVTGQVTNSAGQPVADATVWLGNASWGFESAQTDSMGNYQFTQVPIGSYSVMAVGASSGTGMSTADKSQLAGETNVLVSADGSASGVNVQLEQPAGGLNGTIVDATTHKALSGMVKVKDSDNHVVWESFTDMSGAFTVDLPSGTYLVQTFVGKENFTQQVQVGSNTSGNTTPAKAQLVMPMTAVMGNVETTFGKPAVNTWVTVSDKYGNFVGKSLTDIHGQFLVNGLVPGEYRISVTQGKSTVEKTVQVTLHHTTLQNLKAH